VSECVSECVVLELHYDCHSQSLTGSRSWSCCVVAVVVVAVVVVLLCCCVFMSWLALLLGTSEAAHEDHCGGNVLECVAENSFIHPSIHSRLEYFPARRTQAREDGARVCACVRVGVLVGEHTSSAAETHVVVVDVCFRQVVPVALCSLTGHGQG